MEFELFTTKGGTWQDPTKAESTAVGRAQLFFSAPDKGVFNYNTDEHGRGGIEIELIARTGGDLAGAWFPQGRVGEGLTLSFLNDDTFCAGYWYSYGPRPLQDHSGSRAIKTQRWYMFSGPRKDNGDYELKVSEIEDGKWMDNRAINLEEVGSAELTVVNDKRIKFKYDLDADRVKGKSTFVLEKLF